MNVVLIGMPGCGKSTVGALAAARTGRTFLELDAMVEARESMTIPDLFAQKGEAYFRDAESATVRAAAAEKNAVLSTGGGVVLREENMAALTATGTVFFIDRAPEDIAGEDHGGRPLMAGGKDRVFALYTQRIALYQKYAQYTIKSGPAAEDTLRRLLDAIREAEL